MNRQGVDTMLKEERQQNILDLLEKENKVIASNLSQLFNVSEDTIRRDLKELDQKGLVRRVHSGALKAGPPVTSFNYRQNIASEVKDKLAKSALNFLKENSVIIIDGGTTNLHIAQNLPLDFNATIITNSPPLAVALEQHSNIELIMIGGILYKESMVSLGIDTYQFLQTIRADMYVMGIYNIDPQIGISVPTLTEAQIKRAMIESSAETMGLATSDKLGTVSKNIISSSDSLSYLITENADNKIVKEFSKKNITVINNEM